MTKTGALTVIILVTLSYPAFAGFTKAQTGVSNSTAVNTDKAVTCTFAAPPAKGDLVTVGVSFFDNSATRPSFLSVIDGNNNRYTIDTNQTASDSIYLNEAGFVGQAYLLSAPANAGSSITATFNKQNSGFGIQIWCDDWTPSAGTRAFFDSGGNGNGNPSPITVPTVSVSRQNELVYCTQCNTSCGPAVSGGFTGNEGGAQSGNDAEWKTGLSANTACSWAVGCAGAYNSVGMSFFSGTIVAHVTKGRIARGKINF